ncbi:hypothetical protein ACFSS8_03245 [Paracoccus kondratievae]
MALIGDDRASEGQRLLSPLHYLRRALAPTTDLIEGGLGDVLLATPDVIVLADQPGLGEAPALRDWVEQGGLLIRFVGPRMAASERLSDEPLLPVRLRAGGGMSAARWPGASRAGSSHSPRTDHLPGWRFRATRRCAPSCWPSLPPIWQAVPLPG